MKKRVTQKKHKNFSTILSTILLTWQHSARNKKIFEDSKKSLIFDFGCCFVFDIRIWIFESNQLHSTHTIHKSKNKPNQGLTQKKLFPQQQKFALLYFWLDSKKFQNKMKTSGHHHHQTHSFEEPLCVFVFCFVCTSFLYLMCVNHDPDYYGDDNGVL